MKNYYPVVSEENVQQDPEGFFHLSDYISQVTIVELEKIKRGLGKTPVKLKKIEKHKVLESKIYKTSGFLREIDSSFYLDGAIKLTEADLSELTRLILVGGSDSTSTSYLEELINDFCFKKGSEAVFRGPKYYFLFDSIILAPYGPRTSINNFRITELNGEAFLKDLAVHYNKIHQHFKIFSDFFESKFTSDIRKNKTSICENLSRMLSPDRISSIRSIIASGKHDTGFGEFDRNNRDAWEDTLSHLEYLAKVADDLKEDDSNKNIFRMVNFFAQHKTLLSHAKIVFSIDAEAVIEKYTTIKLPLSARKVLLGLLDAKMNILSFLQNISQILLNPSFMDTEYSGSLVFDRDAVRNIKKHCPKIFESFRTLQKSSNISSQGGEFLGELDAVVSLYMDVLLDNQQTAYIQFLSVNFLRLPEISEGASENLPPEFSEIAPLMALLFQLLQSYYLSCEFAEEIAERKKAKENKPHKRSDRHILLLRKGINRIIRVYREENNPLVMIKTGQNALNSLIVKKFKPREDVLHIMSVNYGGALVGYFAKQVFHRSLDRGQVLANTGSLIYSIYDVQNANTFSALTDYPYSRMVVNGAVPEFFKLQEAQKNWLLIFDDNTNSGETLHNARILAKESGFFDRIDLFPCRASRNLENYKKSLDDIQKLSLVVNSALPTRQTKINKENIRYKELLGSIIGNRIWRENHRRGDSNL